jgi:uncharacterized small protein (DUF1192 family)
MSSQLWTEEQHAAYQLGMQTERDHQNALSRLSVRLHQQEVDALQARITYLEAQLAQAKAGRWQPISDGMVYHDMDIVRDEYYGGEYVESIAFLQVKNNGETLVCGSEPKQDQREAELYELRLCEWVEGDEWEDVPDGEYQCPCESHCGSVLVVTDGFIEIDRDGFVEAFKVPDDWRLQRKRAKETDNG